MVQTGTHPITTTSSLARVGVPVVHLRRAFPCDVQTHGGGGEPCGPWVTVANSVWEAEAEDYVHPAFRQPRYDPGNEDYTRHVQRWATPSPGPAPRSRASAEPRELLTARVRKQEAALESPLFQRRQQLPGLTEPSACPAKPKTTPPARSWTLTRGAVLLVRLEGAGAYLRAMHRHSAFWVFWRRPYRAR